MQGHPPEPPLPDARALRVSDDDRHQVAEVLRRAAGEGRIDLEELDERLEATYQAKTYGELVPLTVDLPSSGLGQPAPGTRPPLPASTGPGPRYSTSVAVMSQSRRAGVWIVEESHTAFVVMGSVLLDLREARFESRDITINACAVMGEVKVIVNAGTSVVVQGLGVMGEFTEHRSQVPFDSSLGGPVVRVRGLAVMGSVSVQRRAQPGQRRARLR